MQTWFSWIHRNIQGYCLFLKSLHRLLCLTLHCMRTTPNDYRLCILVWWYIQCHRVWCTVLFFWSIYWGCSQLFPYLTPTYHTIGSKDIVFCGVTNWSSLSRSWYIRRLKTLLAKLAPQMRSTDHWWFWNFWIILVLALLCMQKHLLKHDGLSFQTVGEHPSLCFIIMSCFYDLIPHACSSHLSLLLAFLGFNGDSSHLFSEEDYFGC